MSKRLISKPTGNAAMDRRMSRGAAYAYADPKIMPAYCKGERFYREDGTGGYEFAVVTHVRPKSYLLKTVEATTNGEFPSSKKPSVDLIPLWDKSVGSAGLVAPAKQDWSLLTNNLPCLRSGHKSGTGYKFWYLAKPGQAYHMKLWWSEW